MVAESAVVVAAASGQASTRGSACSKERRTAELLDTMARRGDDGERGYVGGAAAGVAAMAGEGEGERQGANGCVQGVGAATWGSPRCPRAWAASRWRRGELAHAGVTSLPALAGGSS